MGDRFILSVVFTQEWIKFQRWINITIIPLKCWNILKRDLSFEVEVHHPSIVFEFKLKYINWIPLNDPLLILYTCIFHDDIAFLLVSTHSFFKVSKHKKNENQVFSITVIQYSMCYLLIYYSINSTPLFVCSFTFKTGSLEIPPGFTFFTISLNCINGYLLRCIFLWYKLGLIDPNYYASMSDKR